MDLQEPRNRFVKSESTGRVAAVRRRIRGAFKCLLGVISLPFPGNNRPQDRRIATRASPRQVLQSFATVNNVLFSIAETIPVIGPSIKGALEALYKVLLLVEVSTLSCFRSEQTQLVSYDAATWIRRDFRFRRMPKSCYGGSSPWSST
jgi:hypothetical protein